MRPPMPPHEGTENAELVLQILLVNGHMWSFGAVFPPKIGDYGWMTRSMTVISINKSLVYTKLGI